MLTNISIIIPLLYLHNLYFFILFYVLIVFIFDMTLLFTSSTMLEAKHFNLQCKTELLMMSIDIVSIDVLIENQTFYPVYAVAELCFYMYCNDVENDP